MKLPSGGLKNENILSAESSSHTPTFVLLTAFDGNDHVTTRLLAVIGNGVNLFLYA
jgi:hypothetical protein